MALVIFLFNTLAGYFISISAIYSDSLEIVFGYDELMDLSDLLQYSWPLIMGAFLFTLSYKLSFNRQGILLYDQFAYHPIKRKKTNKGIIDFICIYVQITLIMYVLTKLVINSSMIISHQSILRYLSGKENYLLMLIQSIIIFYASAKIRPLVIVGALFISIIFAWFSGTREAIIPIAALLLYSLQANRKINVFLYIIVLLYIYSFVGISRANYEKFDLYIFVDSLSLAFYALIETTFGFLNYTFGYSVMHFSYVNMTGLGVFTTNDLIYSLTPIPSSFLPEVDTSLWRVDVFRPMGAYSELYRVSPFSYFLFVIFLGGLAKYINNIPTKIVKLILLIIFSLLTIMLFQYGLRTNLWFIVLIIMVIGLYRIYLTLVRGGNQ